MALFPSFNRKKNKKKPAQREEGREGEKKKETGTTAYLQLKGPLPTYNLLGCKRSCLLARHHREEKREEENREEAGQGKREQAASSQKKGKTEKERDREHCLPTAGGTTAYLQLTGVAQKLPLARHHREREKREKKRTEKQAASSKPKGGLCLWGSLGKAREGMTSLGKAGLH